MKNEFTEEQLMKLYEIFIERENEVRRSWRQMLQFYITTCLTIFASIMLISNISSDVVIQKIAIIGGGACMLGISILAFFHFKLDYTYQMELLSVQCKLEDLIGLTDNTKVFLPPRWKNEALLPPFYYANKETEGSTIQFLKAMLSAKSMNFYPLIYIFLSLLSIGTVLIGVFM